MFFFFQMLAETLWAQCRAMFPTKPEAIDTNAHARLMPQPHYADEQTEEALTNLRVLLDTLKEIQDEDKKIQERIPGVDYDEISRALCKESQYVRSSSPNEGKSIECARPRT